MIKTSFCRLLAARDFGNNGGAMQLAHVFAAVVVVLSVGACAQGSTIGGGGSGGTGGTGSGTTHGATNTTGVQSTSSGPATTGSGQTSSQTVGATTGAVTSSSSGLMCTSVQHVCNGTCADNTIATGCFGSATCAPCPASPTNGMAVCSASGQCDVSCSSGYNHVGNACVCATMCCTVNDCGTNQVCTGGTCQNTCDSQTCTATCAATCILQGKLGIGACNNGNCACVCI